MALSDTWLRTTLRKQQVEEFEKVDRDGLSVRVSTLGKLTFQIRYRFNGKAARLSIGHYPTMTLKQAREELARLKDQLWQGNDPRIVKKLEIRANIEVITVDDLFNKWFDEYCVDNYKHPNETKRVFNLHVSPILGDLPFDKVSIYQWYSHFEKLAKKYSTTTKVCLTVCKTMARWGLKRRLIETNPILDIKAGTDLKVKNTKVSRVLNDDEIKMLYRYLDESEMRLSNKVLLKLLLHFGCRGGELRLAKPKDFDLKNKVWTVPIENHKAGKSSGKNLVRPLIDEVVTLIKPVLKACNTEFLFPAIDGGLMPRESLVGMPKLILKWYERRNIEFKKWTTHDLRRTMRTRMSKLTTLDVAEIMLGHTLSEIRGIYDQYDYLEEQEVGYRAWWHCLQAILNPTTPDNVIQFDSIARK